MTPESMSLRPNDEFGNQLEYLLSTRNGYMNNPYEKAAYATQADINKDLGGYGGNGNCSCSQ